MSEASQGVQPVLGEEDVEATEVLLTDADQAIPYAWTQEYMEWRTQELTIDRDRDYPRFSKEYYRRRWRWEAGDKEGDAAFAVTALFAALRATKSHRPQTN